MKGITPLNTRIPRRSRSTVGTIRTAAQQRGILRSSGATVAIDDALKRSCHSSGSGGAYTECGHDTAGRESEDGGGGKGGAGAGAGDGAREEDGRCWGGGEEAEARGMGGAAMRDIEALRAEGPDGRRGTWWRVVAHWRGAEAAGRRLA